jgi:hypothetical protein
MRAWKWYSKTLLALAILAFAYLVWPTPWRYDHAKGVPVRTHRITGETQEFNVPWGW